MDEVREEYEEVREEYYETLKVNDFSTMYMNIFVKFMLLSNSLTVCSKKQFRNLHGTVTGFSYIVLLQQFQKSVIKAKLFNMLLLFWSINMALEAYPCVSLEE